MGCRFLLLFAVCGIGSSKDFQNLSGICGGSILFPVHRLDDTEVMNILWTREDAEHKTKILADLKNDRLNVIFKKFQGRLQLQNSGYSLHMSNLEMGDSGIYKALIFTDGDTIELKYRLQVNERNNSNRGSYIWMNILIGLIIVCIFNEETI
ncbi:T-lymphocyte surface antigen Ly-9 [Bombina bombina]|uniref:T-lymphocyte surface antigen Ly-9 n=1 Tax=Bombina bombina TaxID=8345 RepID=UPI00235A638F|nr:T-lymphocyte surface antigen Ly-9 [Bombina bombina]